MIRRRLLFIFAVTCLACGETEECKQLRAVLKKRGDVLASARSQVSVLKRVEERAEAMETAAKKAKAELGLDKAEEELQAELEARARKLPSGTIERGTRMEPVDEANPSSQSYSVTVWTVRFKEKDLDKVFRDVEEMVAVPPLVKFGSLIHDKGKPDYRLEIVRAIVDEIPIHPKAVELPPPVDLATIPSALGSCGARKLRSEIVKIDAEIAMLRPQAEKTTVLLPASASWEGVKSRTLLLRDTELQNRKNIKTLEAALRAAKLPFKAMAVEAGFATVEVFGGPKDRGKLEKAMVALGAGESMYIPENQPPGVVRLALPNTILEGRRNKNARGPSGVPDGRP